MDTKSEPVSLVIAVKSTDESAGEIHSLKLWGYSCNSLGEVLTDTPVYFVSADDESSVVMDLPAESQYCLIAAVANLENSSLTAETPFTTLSATTLSTKDEDIASRWKIVDLAPNGVLGQSVQFQMQLFPTVARLNVSISNGAEMMSLYVKDLRVCCSAAPQQGALFSALTPDQINNGGANADQWWFSGYSSATSNFSQEIASNISVAGDFMSVGSSLLFENNEGWSNISPFAADGFNAVPEDCNGYYLAISYRYSVVPGIDASEGTTGVCEEVKYIPLAPICRGNEYNMKLKINLGEIYVWGNTEVSEEITGSW